VRMPADMSCSEQLFVAYEGSFVLTENESIANKLRIAYLECSPLLYPSLRESVADLTRRSGIQPIILPQVDFEQLFAQSMDQ